MDKRATKVVKRTNNPVFKEAFAFQLNLAKQDMSFTTVKVVRRRFGSSFGKYQINTGRGFVSNQAIF